jgi:hypothetical protein
VLAEDERDSSDVFETMSGELARIEQRLVELKAQLEAERSRPKKLKREISRLPGIPITPGTSVGSSNNTPSGRTGVGGDEARVEKRKDMKLKPSRKIRENIGDENAVRDAGVRKQGQKLARQGQRARAIAAQAALDSIENLY